MTYHNKFVAVVKVGGRILREVGDSSGDSIVYVPFGSEYSLLFKNLESRKALVKVWIDGTPAISDGRGLVVEPGQDYPLERFVNDMNQGNRFKFIQKTEQIIEHRGDKIDDGIIRIEFQYEKRPPEVHTVTTEYKCTYGYCWDCWNCWRRTCPRYPRPYWSYPTLYSSNMKSAGGMGDISFTVDSMRGEGSTVNCYNANLSSGSMNPPGAPVVQNINSDEGITVQGSISNQQFTHGYIGELEQAKDTIIIRLKGTTSQDKPIVAPVTVNTKTECPTCGKKSPSGTKYCSGCGTFLEIV